MDTALIGIISYFVIGFFQASIIAYYWYKYHAQCDADALAFFAITIGWIILMPIGLIAIFFNYWLKLLGRK